MHDFGDGSGIGCPRMLARIRMGAYRVAASRTAPCPSWPDSERMGQPAAAALRMITGTPGIAKLHVSF